MTAARYDIVIIGTGAGGGTMVHALAGTGARILVVERGDFVPQEDANWDPIAVWRDLRYRTTEQWVDAGGEPFSPYMHYNVGGNSKFWGSVLYRLRREDFGELRHRDGVSPAWPIDYDTLAPYYELAERLYRVHGGTGDDPTEPPRGPYPNPPIPHAPGIARLAEQLRGVGLHPSPLPLGLIDPGLTGGCVLCRTCNSFPCRVHAKSDADVCCVRPALQQPTVTLWTNSHADRLVTDGRGTTIVAAAKKLAKSSGLVGRNYMAHVATMLQGVSRQRNRDEFQKTLAVNDFYLPGPGRPYPLGQIQSQGRTDARMAKIVGDTWTYKGIPMRHIPLWAYEAWVSRANDWLVMTEDLPRRDNRVTLTPSGGIKLAYRVTNLESHQQLVTILRDTLARLGYWSPKVFAHSVGVRNTTHQCGTLVFGSDPMTSVLDPFCRAHDVENLFVVDASFFPSSAAVNPALTIIAQALRTADHIMTTDLRM